MKSFVRSGPLPSIPLFCLNTAGLLSNSAPRYSPPLPPPQLVAQVKLFVAEGEPGATITVPIAPFQLKAPVSALRRDG